MCPRAKSKQLESTREDRVSLFVNYGDITANVTANEENYKATITGKIPQVSEWEFHAFIINFVNSIQKATGAQ